MNLRDLTPDELRAARKNGHALACACQGHIDSCPAYLRTVEREKASAA